MDIFLHLVLKVVIKKNSSFICSGRITNGLYLITLSATEIYDTEIDNRLQTLPLKRKFPLTNLTKVWHLRLGHIN